MGEIKTQLQKHSDLPAQLEAISDPVRITALVQRVVSERLFVTVALSDGQEDYNSTVLGVDTEAGEFLLDALYPETGNEILRREGWLRLTAGFDSTSLTFTSRVMDEGEEAGIRYFRVALPARVDYAQRRGRYRVPVDSIHNVPVILENQQGTTVLGNLHDISASGLSVLLSAPAAVAFGPGEAIPFCVVRIPDDEPIVVGIEVRDLRAEQGDTTVLGAKFIEIDRIAEQRIDRFVTAMERQLLKHRNDE